jgi:hydrogenase maturation protease
VAETSTKSGRGANRGGKLSRLLVVGCGNELAADDSAGVEIVRRLQERGDTGCQVRAAACIGTELLDVFPTVDVILFVDAVASGAPPGTLHLVPLPSWDVEMRAIASLSCHGWGLTETLELAQTLRRPIPRLMLLGVEAGSVRWGAPRSAAVEQAIAAAVDGFPRLRSLLMESDSGHWVRPKQFHPGKGVFPGEGR